MTLLSLQVNASGNDDFGSASFGLLGGIIISEGKPFGFTMRAYYRFVNVTVPNGSVVSQADLQRSAGDTDSTTTIDYNIHCNAADNPSAPANGTALDNLVLTSSSTNVNALNTTAGTWYTSNIAGAVQEVVNRSGFSSGNALMAVVVNGTGTAYRRFQAYDASSTLAAKLDITYTDPIRSQVPYHRRNTIRAMLRR